MTATRILILTLLATTPALADPPRLLHPTPAGGGRPTAVAPAVRPSLADSGTAVELIAWQRRNASQLAAVERAWAALLERMSGFRPAEFERQCQGLTTSLARLDESVLLPAPDRLVDLYVRRLTRHLHAAATACRAGELFNVVYRLEEARTALGEIRWLVAVRTRDASDSPR